MKDDEALIALIEQIPITSFTNERLRELTALVRKTTAEECAKLAEQHSYHSGAVRAARTIRIHFGLIKT